MAIYHDSAQQSQLVHGARQFAAVHGMFVLDLIWPMSLLWTVLDCDGVHNRFVL